MHILLFHPTLLPPRDYGGVERVVLWLAKGLVERGHRVSIAALSGSRLPRGCALIETQRKDYTREELIQHFPKDLDLVHFMAPIQEELWNQLPWPALLTVHGNGKPGEKFPKNTVFLSGDHAKRHGAKEFIYNGIDPAEYRYDPKLKTDQYLFLSKTSWRVKNLAGAMSICKKAKVPLKIAGGNRPWLQHIETWLTPGFTWEGPVHGDRKAELLCQAKGFLFPVLWPEPFGLVVAEALISGTPVIASPLGSLPELIPPGVGAMPRSEAEWISILKNPVLPWDPEKCRSWAMERFHYLVMSEKYEKTYRKIIQGELLHENHPVSRDGWKLKE
jgi:glycosyltransferase involved in cell wall biosynthesis